MALGTQKVAQKVAQTVAQKVIQTVAPKKIDNLFQTLLLAFPLEVI